MGVHKAVALALVGRTSRAPRHRDEPSCDGTSAGEVEMVKLVKPFDRMWLRATQFLVRNVSIQSGQL
jgi:hypothetical protein